jgi:hypothetical protein
VAAFSSTKLSKISKNRLGRKWDRLSKTGIKDIMKEEWEQNIKPQFKPMRTKEYIISIPGEAFGEQSLSSGKAGFTSMGGCPPSIDPYTGSSNYMSLGLTLSEPSRASSPTSTS